MGEKHPNGYKYLQLSVSYKFEYSPLPTLVTQQNKNHWARNNKKYSHNFYKDSMICTTPLFLLFASSYFSEWVATFGEIDKNLEPFLFGFFSVIIFQDHTRSNIYVVFLTFVFFRKYIMNFF